jgi:hypothetical protein
MEFEFEFEFEDVRLGGKWGRKEKKRKEKRMHACKSCPVLFVCICVWFASGSDRRKRNE